MAGYTDVTGLGRELDPRVPSNRAAIVGSVAAVVVLGLVSVVRDEWSILGTLVAAIAVFLGWAVSRQLDPDRPDAATWAMIVALAAALIAPPSALASGVALIAMRLVSGSVGVALKAVDVVVLAAVVAVAGGQPFLWVFGAALAIWAWSAPEAQENRTAVRAALVVGLLAGLGYAGWVTWFGDGFDVEITGDAYALAAVAGLAMILSVRRLTIDSMCDGGHARIDAERVRLARVVAGSGLMWAAVFGGVDAFWALGPVAAALIVAAVYRVFVHAT